MTPHGPVRYAGTCDCHDCDGREVAVVIPAVSIEPDSQLHVPVRARCGTIVRCSQTPPDGAPDDGLRADGGEITVCPQCDSADVSIVSARSAGDGGPATGRYHCAACEGHFDEPAERPPESAPGRAGLAGFLANAPPNADWDDLRRLWGEES